MAEDKQLTYVYLKNYTTVTSDVWYYYSAIPLAPQHKLMLHDMPM